MEHFYTHMCVHEINTYTSTFTADLKKNSVLKVFENFYLRLQVIKERLVVVRRDIPERMRPLKSLVSQVESVQIGLKDLNQWLDDATSLLESHRVDGNINSVEDRLDSHTVSRRQRHSTATR